MNKIFKVLILLLLSVILGVANAYELPNLGEHSATIFSAQEEEMLGKAFFFEIAQQVTILQDPIIEDYVQTLGNKLVSHSSAPNKQFHFFVIADPTINAFAGPGAYVGIHTGAILVSRTESELAAIMAHEISHVTQHHIERIFEQQQGIQIPALAAMAAAVILGAASNSRAMGDVANGAMMATMAGTAQNQINFTREQESEADHIGMRVLATSGFDPNAMAASFQHVQRTSFNFNNDDYPAALSDHPQTSERIADASARANFYLNSSVKSSKEFYLVQARIKAMQIQESSRAVSYFKALVNKNNSEIALYGYALSLDANHQYPASENILRTLIKSDSNEILYQLALADTQEDAKERNNAEATLTNALKQRPYFYPLVLQYADALLQNQKPQAAASFLRTKLPRYPDKSTIYFMLAQAQGKTGNLADAYQARAKAMELEGLYNQALLLLQQAQKTPNLSFNDKAVIQARIQQLKVKIARNHLKA